VFKQCVETATNPENQSAAVKVHEQVPASCTVQDPFGSFTRVARKVCKLVVPLILL